MDEAKLVKRLPVLLSQNDTDGGRGVRWQVFAQKGDTTLLTLDYAKKDFLDKFRTGRFLGELILETDLEGMKPLPPPIRSPGKVYVWFDDKRQPLRGTARMNKLDADEALVATCCPGFQMDREDVQRFVTICSRSGYVRYEFDLDDKTRKRA